MPIEIRHTRRSAHPARRICANAVLGALGAAVLLQLGAWLFGRQLLAPAVAGMFMACAR
jgi:hypothetical protein